MNEIDDEYIDGIYKVIKAYDKENGYVETPNRLTIKRALQAEKMFGEIDNG